MESFFLWPGGAACVFPQFSWERSFPFLSLRKIVFCFVEEIFKASGSELQHWPYSPFSLNWIGNVFFSSFFPPPLLQGFRSVRFDVCE